MRIDATYQAARQWALPNRFTMNDDNVVDLKQSRSAQTHKEKKLKTMKKAFASYLGEKSDKKKVRRKKSKRAKKK